MKSRVTPIDAGQLGVRLPTAGNEPPAAGWEWRGPAEIGAWYNPRTGESLRPDLKHPLPVGPHWDYKDARGHAWRIMTDGIAYMLLPHRDHA